MRRRDLIAGLLVAAATGRALAQQARKVPRVALLTTSSPPGSPAIDAFVQELRDLGYVDGRDIMIEWRWGRGATERFPEFAAEAVRLNVDVIVAANTAAGLAAQKATKTIPIVIATMEEPVRNGLVASIARPGGNITGLDFQPTDLQGKRLQLFKEAFPTISRLAVLIDSAGRPLTREIEMIAAESAAQALSIRLQPVIEVKSAEEIAGAFKAIAGDGADGILEVGGTMFFANRIEMAERALKSRIPVMCNLRDEAATGCLMSYGSSVVQAFRRAAGLVDKILKGAKPADLPVERPAKFELVINLKTAKALALTIPPALLAVADEVIE
jgi:putative ABC transport system substrate-binding protein